MAITTRTLTFCDLEAIPEGVQVIDMNVLTASWW